MWDLEIMIDWLIDCGHNCLNYLFICFIWASLLWWSSVCFEMCGCCLIATNYLFFATLNSLIHVWFTLVTSLRWLNDLQLLISNYEYWDCLSGTLAAANDFGFIERTSSGLKSYGLESDCDRYESSFESELWRYLNYYCMAGLNLS